MELRKFRKWKGVAKFSHLDLADAKFSHFDLADAKFSHLTLAVAKFIFRLVQLSLITTKKNVIL